MEKVLMLGDSLIEWGDWESLLPEYKIINRGYAGETVGGLAGRLAGLLRRRKEEAKLFCTPCSSSTTTVSKVSQESEVTQYAGETNGHCQVELAYEQGVWYVYQKHWELPWEKNQELFGDLNLGNDLASRIIKYMKTKGYKVFTNPKEYNIVYIEGMKPDGNLNDDRPNCFNDLRTVIEFTDGKPKIVGKWVATTEPGSHYTYNPMNAKGAARIKFGQYKAWKVGIHGSGRNAHEGLRQCGEITVHRDKDKDFKRDGDKLDTGSGFYINQHHGFNNSTTNIGTASAGCLVGRTVQGHREFMNIIKQDKRYKDNKRYIFYTTIIPGDDLNEQFPPHC